MKLVSGLVSGQVLQRLGAKGAAVVLVGATEVKGPIHATIFQGKTVLRGWKKRRVGHAVRGEFTVKLASVPVGGPYRLRLEAGRDRIDIAPFFVGDVWVLAGQSNMEGVGNMTGRAKPHPLVQAFSMRRQWRLATDPLHVLAESPDKCHTTTPCTAEVGEELRRNAIKGTGVGIFFAREMIERSGGVPQGLICAAHGGTSMQQWDPARKHLGGESLYASMLTSVQATGQPVAGVLWYQGESDANPADAVEYTKRMQALVAATRRDFRQPRLPWIIVQIGRHITDQSDPRAWNEIQDQQRLLPGKITGLETVAAIDLSMDDGIHIGSAGYPLLATRLASAADRLVLGNRRELRGPQFRKIGRIVPSSRPALEVEFDSVHGGLQAPGEPVGFRLVDDHGAPQEIIYRTELLGNKVRLHLTRTPLGVAHLFYGHGFSPICNITDARGFSLPVFGPIPIGDGKRKALLPFLTQWKITEIIPATKKLNRVAIGEVKALNFTAKSYPEQGFINEHAAWENKSGQAFFQARIELSEPMELQFLMGYDGPFRLWLDGQPFFVNLQGTNPCFPDESAKTVKLPPGVHEITVGMDLNGGRAWGFFLRFARRDVSQAQIESGNYARPVYL